VILCLDAGNSCLKWGIADAAEWQVRGELPWTELAQLRQIIVRWQPLHAYLASVVGPVREGALKKALANTPLTRFTGLSNFPSITNGYTKPETLGADRWCALIAARQMEKLPCLVAILGTATTMDALDGEGNFLGGMILPGVNMMKTALAKGTANLPLVQNETRDTPHDSPLFPTDTDNAILGGCLEAQAGAIERAFARLPNAARCIISGGAAPLITPRLSHLPLQLVPQLVLEGVLLLANAESRDRAST